MRSALDISRRLNLDSIYLEPSTGRRRRRTSIRNLDALSPDLLRPLSFTLSSGKRDSDQILLENIGSYVSYAHTEKGQSLVAFSANEDCASLVDWMLDQNVLTSLKGVYGFALDWPQAASFWAYAYGFQDVKSMSGNLSMETQAGRWGVQYRSTPDLLEVGTFRDIFPFSFLSTAHIHRAFRGHTLLREILSSAYELGSIRELLSDWYFWSVPADRINLTRVEFQSGGLFSPP